MKTIWQKNARRQIQKQMAGQVFWKPAMIFSAARFWSGAIHETFVFMLATGILFE